MFFSYYFFNAEFFTRAFESYNLLVFFTSPQLKVSPINNSLCEDAREPYFAQVVQHYSLKPSQMRDSV